MNLKKRKNGSPLKNDITKKTANYDNYYLQIAKEKALRLNYATLFASDNYCSSLPELKLISFLPHISHTKRTANTTILSAVMIIAMVVSTLRVP